MPASLKSSITLPPNELRMVTALKQRLRLRSNVEVVRRGLQMLQEDTDRRALKQAYRKASQASRGITVDEIAALDHLSSEGLD
jgi:Arc/MetJ-type ribon-helix-helix transcriptional regulator